MADRIMKEIKRVNGPYKHATGRLKGRSYLTVYYIDGSKGTTLLSRWKMEQKLGRRLERFETVDHIDEDFNNDAIENLQILPIGDNIRKNKKS